MRRLLWERDLTRAAARLFGLGDNEADAATHFAQTRAGGGPIRGLGGGRNFAREAIEEAADGCNYCSWGIDDLGVKGEDCPDTMDDFSAALGAFAYAHYRLRRIQQRRRDEY